MGAACSGSRAVDAEPGPLASPGASPSGEDAARPARRRRGSVSAESDVDYTAAAKLKVIPKEEPVMEKIRNSIGDSFLFKSLDHATCEDIILAMEEMNVKEGDNVITEGTSFLLLYYL